MKECLNPPKKTKLKYIYTKNAPFTSCTAEEVEGWESSWAAPGTEGELAHADEVCTWI